jgi:hypothetical protein
MEGKKKPVHTTIYIVSLTKGLIYKNMITITSDDSLANYFWKQSKSTSKLTRIDNEIYITIPDILTFNIPDIID